MIAGLVHSGTGGVTNPAQADLIIRQIFDQINLALLDGNEIFIPGIGKLGLTLRRGRNGVHPRTREQFTSPPKLTVRFKAASPLLNSLQNYCLDKYVADCIDEEDTNDDD